MSTNVTQWRWRPMATRGLRTPMMALIVTSLLGCGSDSKELQKQQEQILAKLDQVLVKLTALEQRRPQRVAQRPGPEAAPHRGQDLVAGLPQRGAGPERGRRAQQPGQGEPDPNQV